MVMEMCEIPLKDWLAERQSLSTDDLEAILGFSLNIGRGVEHLHSLKVSAHTQARSTVFSPRLSTAEQYKPWAQFLKYLKICPKKIVKSNRKSIII